MSIEALAFAKMTDLGAIEDAVIRLLYQNIAENQYNDTRVCRVKQAQFAAELRRDVRSVRRYLDTLEQHGFILRRTKREAGSGNVLYDEIRIVGFTRWYRSGGRWRSGFNPAPKAASKSTFAACGKSLPDILSGSRKQGKPGGQNVRQLADNRCPVASGQQESGTVVDYPTLVSDSNNPPNPPKAWGTGDDDFDVQADTGDSSAVGSAGATGKPAALIAALRADAVEMAVTDHLLAPVLSQRRVRRLGSEPVAALRGLRRDARHLGVDALKRACQDVLEASPVDIQVSVIREAIASAKTAGARIVIARGSAEWGAWMDHWQTADPGKHRLHQRLDRTQVPSRFPVGYSAPATPPAARRHERDCATGVNAAPAGVSPCEREADNA